MGEILNYPSRLSDPDSRRFETFSYLPAMNAEQIRKQVQFLADRGWTPALEHTEPSNASLDYWYMWKLPMFGEADVDRILDEAEACHRAYPDHHVRLIGYDRNQQSLGASLVIYRAQPR